MPEPVILPMRGLAAIRQANMNPWDKYCPKEAILQKEICRQKANLYSSSKARSQRGYGPSDGNQDAQVVPQFPLRLPRHWSGPGA